MNAVLCLIALYAPNVRPVHVFFDHHEIESMRACSLVMHRPERKEIVYRFDAPWEGKESAYVTVLACESGFRMYYRGASPGGREYTCMAESVDGINWIRPQLSLYSYESAKTTNIVHTAKEKYGRESHNFAPFLDTNPSCRPEEKWKAVGMARWPEDGEQRRAQIALASPDGIHWRRVSDVPIITEGSFDSQNTAFWDGNLGQYVSYIRHGWNGLRAIRRSVSPDFRTWSKPQWLVYKQPQTEQFYTNAIVPYSRTPGLYIGLPMRFVPERKSVGFPPKTTDGLSDCVFMTSRDGLHWDRTFKEAFIRPGLDPANWGSAHGNNTPAWGILQTSPTELSLYVCEQYEKGVPVLRRHTLRLDGFASVHAGATVGTITTKPILVEGARLVLNMSTSAAGLILVEVLDEKGKPFDGLTKTDCLPIYGDDISRAVQWKTSPKLPEGQKVRLKFTLIDADLYSYAFSK